MKSNNVKMTLASCSKFVAMCFVAVALSFSLNSCEEEDSSSSSGDCSTEMAALVEIMQAKTQAFANNSSAANCSAVRTAALNVVAKAESCGQGSAFANLKAQWQNMDCSEFDN